MYVFFLHLVALTSFQYYQYILFLFICDNSDELMQKMAKHPILNISIFTQMYTNDKKFCQYGARLSCKARGPKIQSFSSHEIYSNENDAVFKMYVHVCCFGASCFFYVCRFVCCFINFLVIVHCLVTKVSIYLI